MTELQPTEIELTAKKRKPASLSKRKIAVLVLIVLLAAGLVVLTVMLANMASRSPDLIQGSEIPTSPAAGSAAQ
jgi:hypothetical protein